MQSCQALETSNREGLKMGDTFPVPRRTTSLKGEFRKVFGSTLQNYITSTSAVISLYTCICPQRVLHLNNMSHKNFLRCIIAIFIVRMFEGWRVVRCGFGGRS